MSRLHIRRAVGHLRVGGVVAYPTEAVFGLGCDPFDEDAVAKVYAIKSRPPQQGVILIAATANQLEPLLQPLDADTHAAVYSSWPGPVTWVLPAAQLAPPWVCADGGTLAVRVTAHPVAAALCRDFGAPIVSTSANFRGALPACNTLQVRSRLGRADIDYILPGATGGAGRPSEIRDGSTRQVLRAGG